MRVLDLIIDRMVDLRTMSYHACIIAGSTRQNDCLLEGSFLAYMADPDPRIRSESCSECVFYPNCEYPEGGIQLPCIRKS